MIFPVLPLSAPDKTFTVSPFLMCNFDILNRFYNTSGASETIFMYCLSRNSRATGPKTRVPLIWSVVSNKTQALSSKRI